MFVERVESLH